MSPRHGQHHDPSLTFGKVKVELDSTQLAAILRQSEDNAKEISRALLVGLTGVADAISSLKPEKTQITSGKVRVAQ